MRLIVNRTLAITLCLISGFTFSLPALGWGQTGHRVTGAIAEHYLSPSARAAVTDIIPNESLAEASTWPDEMRSNPDEYWQKTANPWHYVTVPKGSRYSAKHAPEHGDAMTALSNFRNTLLDDTASKNEKQRALRFIVHIIGDLHQPLHAGNGTDKGGNDVKVRFFWEDSNLHRVWDSQMLDQRQLSYTEWTNWLLQKISPEDIRQWHTAQPKEWIAESTELRDQLYPEDANNMAYDYLYDHLPTAKQRLQQAGVRIAIYLNQLFDERAATK